MLGERCVGDTVRVRVVVWKGWTFLGGHSTGRLGSGRTKNCTKKVIRVCFPND